MRTLPRQLGLALGLGAILLGSGVGLAVAQNYWQLPAKVTSRAPTPHNQAFFPVNRCINVGGALEAPNEGEWFDYKIRRNDFNIIAKAGFDTVRIPIKWSAHAQERPPYTIDPAFFARIDQVISWALQARLNVIINVHHYDELYKDPDRHEARLEGLWTQISGRYKNLPANVMFEIINEPRDAFSGRRVNVTQARALSVIRKTNPSRTTILSGDQWGNINGLDNLVLPSDPFVVSTVHYYSPFGFTHQGAEFLNDPPPVGRVWPKPGDEASLKKDVQRIAAFRSRTGVPIFLGEFGSVDNISLNQRAQWTGAVQRAFAEQSIPTCFFNFSAGMNAYDTKTESWKMPLLRALIPASSR